MTFGASGTVALTRSASSLLEHDDVPKLCNVYVGMSVTKQRSGETMVALTAVEFVAVIEALLIKIVMKNMTGVVVARAIVLPQERR